MEDFGDIFNIIKNHIERGKSLISNVRKLAKLDSDEFELYPINISSVLKESIKHIKTSYQERSINIETNGINENTMVQGNELLADIFDNILNNAFKYMHSNKDIKIIISASKHQEQGKKFIKLEFKDFGIGIPDEKKKNLVYKNIQRRY
ncbi:MAG: sensor histidine kinase [Promethearchaeota archaeon]